jgi:hypothetical protein
VRSYGPDVLTPHRTVGLNVTVSSAARGALGPVPRRRCAPLNWLCTSPELARQNQRTPFSMCRSERTGAGGPPRPRSSASSWARSAMSSSASGTTGRRRARRGGSYCSLCSGLLSAQQHSSPRWSSTSRRGQGGGKTWIP